MSFRLDPAARALLDAADQAGVEPVETLTVEEARAQYRDNLATLRKHPPQTIGAVEDRHIDGPDGGVVPIRIYRPESAGEAATLPVTVFFHGGGWVIGDLDTHDPLCRSLCRQGGCVVVAADYRLAPEHRFPAAVDDALAVTRWVSDNAGVLGVDRHRLTVVGDSAGGNLAAVVSLLARDAGDLPVAMQGLIYPATDMTMSYPSIQSLGDGYRLTRDAMAWFIDHYLGAGSRFDIRASPDRAGDLSGLPPALVITAGFDPLRDEGDAYAERLQQAGVAVESYCFGGMIHGFVTLAGVLPQAEDAIALIARRIREGAVRPGVRVL